MVRPKTKEALIEQAYQQFNQMFDMLEDLSSEDKVAAFSFDKPKSDQAAHWTRDKNIRDVYIHLHEWHQLLINWLVTNLNNQSSTFLPTPYNWKTYGDMNMMFWEKHQITSYDHAEQMVKDSHREIMSIIINLDEKELFEKGYYDWSGKTSIGSYCVSATCSHYEWAKNKIKRHRKQVLS